MRVCQYLSNDHPLYLKMVANSIHMLRKHNDIIKVRLHLVHDDGQITKTTNHQGDSLSIKSKYSVSEYIKLFQDMDVEVVEREPLELEGEEGFFHIHRSLLKDTEEESLLFIDADTFIFKDVEELFDKYSEYDYVGLPIHYLDGWNKSWLPFKPYNSAVNLWNNSWICKFAEALPSYCRQLRERTHVCGNWCYERCNRGTGREELSTSLFVDDNCLKHTVWDNWDVRNSASLKDYDEAPQTCIFHTFTHNWQRAKGLYIGKRIKFKPTLIHMGKKV
jgi:hypothetical protein